MPSEVGKTYQEALKRAIAPLTEEQLQRRLMPGLRTPGEIAEHIVFGRALWLHRTLGEGAAELTPLLRWEDAGDSPRTAAEILHGLELTWRLITVCLMRGSPTDAIPEEEYRSCRRSGVSSITTCPTPGNCRCCWVRMACLGLICSSRRLTLRCISMCLRAWLPQVDELALHFGLR